MPRFMPAQNPAPLRKAAKEKLAPQTTANKLPWLDGRFPSINFVNVDGSVRVPGEYDSAITTPVLTQPSQTSDATQITRTKGVTGTEASKTEEVTEIDEEIIETEDTLEAVETEEANGTEELARIERTDWAEEGAHLRGQHSSQSKQASYTHDLKLAGEGVLSGQSTLTSSSGDAKALREEAFAPDRRARFQSQYMVATVNVPSTLHEETPPPPADGRRSSFLRARTSSNVPTIATTSSGFKEERRKSSLAPVPAHLEEPITPVTDEEVPFQAYKQFTETATILPRSQTTSDIKEERRMVSLAPVQSRHEAQYECLTQVGDTITTSTSAQTDNVNFGEKRRRISPLPSPLHTEELHSPHVVVEEGAIGLIGQDASQTVVVKSAQLSPNQPTPKRNVFERARGHKRLSNAIENLEGMVQEAVEIADQHSDHGQIQEVHDIIKDATVAVQEAAKSPPERSLHHVSPLPMTESSSSESRLSSEQNLDRQRKYKHVRIGLTERTFVDQKSLKTLGKEQSQESRTEAHDFAYGDHAVRAERLSPTERLRPLQPAQASTREHTEVVFRPTRMHEETRGRPRRRRSRKSEPQPERYHHRHRFGRGEAKRSSSAQGRDRETHEHHNHHHHPVDSPFASEDEKTRFLQDSYDKREYAYGLGVSVRDHHEDYHTFSLRRHHRRQPISRNWSTLKKRITATIACINTALLGIIIGIYAGMVPGIQYYLGDEQHYVILGNVVLFAGIAITTFIFWPLPLLHGRKPYILASLALAMPLHFPQAAVVSSRRAPRDYGWRVGLLFSRALTGLVLGFAYINFITVLLDLFGASLQSKNPHQELVVVNDVRRHGGGMGMWLGIWSWCAIASLAIGFQIGAVVIERLNPAWGFYIAIIILAAALVINILAPETRRSSYRRSVTEVYDRDENFITRRVTSGEIKLHLGIEGPKYWFEEVWAGIKLTTLMCMQPGFIVLAVYLGWIYTQIVLVIVLLGALLSRDYRWTPRYVGLGVMPIAFGALLAIPLTKAGVFSRERKRPYRTDSMTFEKQVTWTSHLVRRVVFTVALPLMGLAYTFSSWGRPKPYIVPILFAGAIGFFSILAIAECIGLIMETFDTCDLQPGVNTRHRLQSMAVQDRRRRTNYSSFPRVSAGIFASQTLAFVGAAVATEVGGILTRNIGAMASTGVTAGILLALTILLTAVLWRYREVQVIPHYTGSNRASKTWESFKEVARDDWKAVVIGNPSGKMRRMSVLELGSLSRWTEIRKLNYLIRDDRGIGVVWVGGWGQERYRD